MKGWTKRGSANSCFVKQNWLLSAVTKPKQTTTVKKEAVLPVSSFFMVAVCCCQCFLHWCPAPQPLPQTAPVTHTLLPCPLASLIHSHAHYSPKCIQYNPHRHELQNILNINTFITVKVFTRVQSPLLRILGPSLASWHIYLIKCELVEMVTMLSLHHGYHRTIGAHL